LECGDLTPLSLCSSGALSKITKRRRAAHSKRMTEEDYNPFPEPVVIEITDVFDLHTIPPKQVKAVVEEYLHEAHAKGFRVVRIIHGKGKGVQREIVRSVLERTYFVIDWTDAPPDAGGLGATIVRLAERT
jgi:DNA-nicking Smr family endonuclease